MLILRIRQAEVALADGRLEEACRLVRAEDLRSHRKGQELVTRLAAALVARGQEHLAGGRHPQAFADAQMAFELGGNQPEIAQLQRAVAAALMDRQQSQAHKVQAEAAAQRHLRDGQLTMARDLLVSANSTDGPQSPLLKEVADRRGGAEMLLARARQALEREDLHAAIRLVRDAERLHAAGAQVMELSGRLVERVTAEIRQAVDQGRLDRAAGWLERIEPLAGRTMDVQELAGIVARCRLAGQCIQAGRPAEAERILRQLAGILPAAVWLPSAIEAAGQAAAALEHLRTGPVGLVTAMSDGSPERDDRAAADDYQRQVAAGPATRAMVQGMELPERFLLQVDGVGSCLVVRGRRVTVGPSRASGSPDVPLLAESGLAAVTIERVDEDYFLRSDEMVVVNERAATQRLLVDGDQVALSARCRMKFAVPNAASTSAVLQLAGTRLPRTDARRVILLDRELIIGPGTASHVRADGLTDPVVLYVRDNRLCCRATGPVAVGEQVLDETAGLPMGTSVRVGGISLVVTQA